MLESVHSFEFQALLQCPDHTIFMMLLLNKKQWGWPERKAFHLHVVTKPAYHTSSCLQEPHSASTEYSNWRVVYKLIHHKLTVCLIIARYGCAAGKVGFLTTFTYPFGEVVGKGSSIIALVPPPRPHARSSRLDHVLIIFVFSLFFPPSLLRYPLSPRLSWADQRDMYLREHHMGHPRAQRCCRTLEL